MPRAQIVYDVISAEAIAGSDPKMKVKLTWNVLVVWRANGNKEVTRNKCYLCVGCIHKSSKVRHVFDNAREPEFEISKLIGKGAHAHCEHCRKPLWPK